MSNAFILDTTEFDGAVVQYAAASGKDFADVSNRQTLNLAIQGLKLQKKAENAEIKKLQSLDWWPKYIAKLLTAKRGHYTRAEAIEYSAQVIRGRSKAVGFMKFFFASMAAAVAPLTGRSRGKGKDFAGFKVSIQPATSEKPITDCAVSYTYRRRGDKTAKRTEIILQSTLAQAISATIADIQSYVDRKMRVTANKYSARMI